MLPHKNWNLFRSPQHGIYNNLFASVLTYLPTSKRRGILLEERGGVRGQYGGGGSLGGCMLGGLASCFWSFVDRYHCLSVHLSAKTQSLFLDAWKDPKRIVPRIHLIGPYLHWPTAAVEIYTSHLNFCGP